MKYKFHVITHIPDLFEEGNKSDEWGYYQVNDNITDIIVGTSNKRKPDFTNLKTKVFEVGEIIICDESGREVCYPGRKPSKWIVEYEIFDSLDDAVLKAISIS